MQPVVLRELERVDVVLAALTHTSHNGFPVVYSESMMRSHPRLGSLAGLITRRELSALLAMRAFHAELPQMPFDVVRPNATRSTLSAFAVTLSGGHVAPETAADGGMDGAIGAAAGGSASSSDRLQLHGFAASQSSGSNGSTLDSVAAALAPDSPRTRTLRASRSLNAAAAGMTSPPPPLALGRAASGMGPAAGTGNSSTASLPIAAQPGRGGSNGNVNSSKLGAIGRGGASETSALTGMRGASPSPAVRLRMPSVADSSWAGTGYGTSLGGIAASLDRGPSGGLAAAVTSADAFVSSIHSRSRSGSLSGPSGAVPQLTPSNATAATAAAAAGSTRPGAPATPTVPRLGIAASVGGGLGRQLSSAADADVALSAQLLAESDVPAAAAAALAGLSTSPRQAQAQAHAQALSRKLRRPSFVRITGPGGMDATYASSAGGVDVAGDAVDAAMSGLHGGPGGDNEHLLSEALFPLTPRAATATAGGFGLGSVSRLSRESSRENLQLLQVPTSAAALGGRARAATGTATESSADLAAGAATSDGGADDNSGGHLLVVSAAPAAARFVPHEALLASAAAGGGGETYRITVALDGHGQGYGQGYGHGLAHDGYGPGTGAGPGSGDASGSGNGATGGNSAGGGASGAAGGGGAAPGATLRFEASPDILELVYDTEPLLSEEAISSFYPRHADVSDLRLTQAERGMYVDLRPYLNPTPFTIHVHAPGERAFELFRSLGLRHLLVTNDSHDVVGVITRHDLLASELRKRCQEKRERRERVRDVSVGTTV